MIPIFEHARNHCNLLWVAINRPFRAPSPFVPRTITIYKCVAELQYELLLVELTQTISYQDCIVYAPDAVPRNISKQTHRPSKKHVC